MYNYLCSTLIIQNLKPTGKPNTCLHRLLKHFITRITIRIYAVNHQCIYTCSQYIVVAYILVVCITYNNIIVCRLPWWIFWNEIVGWKGISWMLFTPHSYNDLSKHHFLINTTQIWWLTIPIAGMVSLIFINMSTTSKSMPPLWKDHAFNQFWGKLCIILDPPLMVS